MRTRILHSWETRKYSSTVHTSSDPTGDTIEWAAVDVDAADQDPAGWTAGSWSGSYDSAAETALALSPTFGTSESTISPDVTLTEGTTYYVYARTRNLSDVPGELVAVVKVT